MEGKKQTGQSLMLADRGSVSDATIQFKTL